MNIGVNEVNDIVMVDGGLPLVEGLEEIRQLLKQTLNSYEADWFLNLELGLPYFQTILRKTTTISELESIYLDAISGVTGVLDIETFNLSFDTKNRVVDISFRVITSDGKLDFNTSLDGVT